MANLITNSLRINNADAFSKKISDEKTYIFIGRSQEWENEEAPPCTNLSDKFINQTYTDLLGIKSIPKNSTCSLAIRYNWTQGNIYDGYDSTVNMVDDRKTNNAPYIFYVLNSENNVYKCLNNANGKPSLQEPTGTPIDYIELADGYTWKYMYSIAQEDIDRYMLSGYMPIYTKYTNDGSLQWQVQEAASGGTVDFIKVVNGGSGYIASNAPAVTIEGDGTGAQGIVEINPVTRVISNIKITNHGTGYTRATVKLSGTNQSATFNVVISPKVGHGKDARLELGGTYLSVVVDFEGSEGGNLPIVEYRQTGIIKNVMTKTTMNALKINKEDSALFVAGSTIKGASSNATATVVYNDVQSGVLYYGSNTGDFTQGEKIVNNTNKLETTVESIMLSAPLPAYQNALSSNDIKNPSGEFLYIVNRVKIQRTESLKETVILIISF